MKKTLILSLLAVGLTACETMNRPPYSGGMGEYGFTYDLNGTPSPFVDTSYRPLTPYDLAAPIIITVLTQAPPQVIYQSVPEIGATKYSGESPRTAVIVSGAPQINEAAGADRGTAGAGGQAGGGGGYAPSGGGGYGGYYAPGVAAVFPSGSITNTNNIPTNNIPTNGIPTNNIPTNNIPTNNFPTNNFPTNNFPTNQFPTNRVPLPTNPVPTNAFNAQRPEELGREGAPRGFTNNRTFQNQNPQAPAQGQAPAVNEPAGTQNQPQGQNQGQGATPQSVPFGPPPSGGGAPVQSPAPAPAPAAPATPASP